MEHECDDAGDEIKSPRLYAVCAKKPRFAYGARMFPIWSEGAG